MDVTLVRVNVQEDWVPGVAEVAKRTRTRLYAWFKVSRIQCRNSTRHKPALEASNFHVWRLPRRFQLSNTRKLPSSARLCFDGSSSQFIH